ncbi:MAG TPA: NADH-quinone oxidoreductase subunit C [Anaerolineaceae bacterium]|nr:NADH-quinone oxidoreductase subunit C [Anaerolineaceae bacterium]
MDTATTLQKAKEILTPLSGAMTSPEEERLDVILTVSQLLPAIRALRQADWGYLSAITGLDHPDPVASVNDTKQWERMAELGDTVPGSQTTLEGGVEVLYHFCECAAIVTLRIVLPYSRARIPSVCDLIPSATLYERELMEMFGVDVEGTPNPDKLLLPDDWPDGVYPMRKSYIVETPSK